MATFGELQTSVSKRLLDASNTAVSSSDVATAINSAIDYWKTTRFYFNVVEDTVSLTAQDGTIPVTGSVLGPSKQDGAFVVEYSNMRYPLQKISENTYNAWFLENGYGIPRFYARVGQSYEMYPLPDSAYILRRSYYKDYTDLVNSSDTNDFTDYADRLIMFWACAELIGGLRQDDKMEGYFTNKAMDEKNRLLGFTNKLNSSGRLVVSSGLLN